MKGGDGVRLATLVNGKPFAHLDADRVDLTQHRREEGWQGVKH